MRPSPAPISILGPLQVTLAGGPVGLPAKQRTILAVLALHANRPVGAERLVEACWGRDAAPGVGRTLPSHLFQLRRALAIGGDDDDERMRIVSDSGGYRLAADPAIVDATAFLDLLRAASADGTDARCAIASLSEALGMWRQPRVADVGDEPSATAEAHHLEELRLSAVEDLARLRITTGAHAQAVPDLRRAVADAPYNERLWASLMLALARSGRRAESLIAYRHAQEALRRELDIEPGSELQLLAQRIRDGAVGPADPPANGEVAAPGGGVGWIGQLGWSLSSC